MIAAVLWIGAALELALYTLLTVILQRLGWQWGPALTLCVALAVSWRTGFILMTFRLSRVAPRPAWALTETAAFTAATVLMMFAPLMARVSRGESGRAPVLLLHGWNCNSGIWWPLRQILRRSRCGDVYTVNLPAWRSLDAHVQFIAVQVEEILASSGHARIALVGHSMGGVIGRLYLASDQGRDRVARLVTLGSPHHGTSLGHRALDPAGRDLNVGSVRVTGLPPLGTDVPVTAMYSEIDNFVAPQSSALLEGAENLSCGDIGHLQLLFTVPVLQAVAVRLEHTR